RGIPALLAPNDRAAGPLSPYLELFGRGGAEGIARRQQDPLAAAHELGGELSDRRRLADPVYADGEDHERLGARSVERLGIHREQFCRLRLDGAPYGIRIGDLRAG